MSLQTVRLIDPSRNLVAVAAVAGAADRLEGTIDLGGTPPAARAVFEEFEEVVSGQMFSFLDEVEAKVAALGLSAVFPDGSVAPVTRLQVYPGTGDVSFAVADADRQPQTGRR